MTGRALDDRRDAWFDRIEDAAIPAANAVAEAADAVAEPGAAHPVRRPKQAHRGPARGRDDRPLGCQQLRAQVTRIAETRRVVADWQLVQEHGAVPCLSELSGLLAQAITTLGYPVERLPSGAGHDAAVMTAIAPIAMLFVRCKGGISHHPAESVKMGDVRVAIEVLAEFIMNAAKRYEPVKRKA